jgi:hypothetical protein
MKEEEPEKSVLEIHEEFLQRVEAGSSKIRALSVVTIVVAFLLTLSYVYQVASAYLTPATTVTVNLRDPVLVAFEVVLTALAVVWLYVGIRDYRFVSSLSKSISRARVLEKDIEREISEKKTTAT